MFPWAGLSYDGGLAFTNTATIQVGTPSVSSIYAFPPVGTGATPLAVTGIPTNLQAGTPAFSADTSKVAFTFLKSKSSGAIPGLSCTNDCLVAMNLNTSSLPLTFSNVQKLTDIAGHNVAFPSFFPTNDAVAFNYQVVAGDAVGNYYVGTRNNAQAQIWWSNIPADGTTTAQPIVLNALNGLNANGVSYLPYPPGSDTTHQYDANLNFEPTINPVASGGYVWVVFTSRRLYGNVAIQNAWLSDPRNYRYKDPGAITTKKLWVAAVNLGAPAGSDPSHPAFYLPAQELIAGNARGYWVLDPCRSSGTSCTSGDQCCNGYCSQVTSTSPALTCSGKPANVTCSSPQEPCNTVADCCISGNLCVSNLCTTPSPPTPPR